MDAVVFDIKRFAVHDGPGIRSSVFLKGCPLNCLWCHNPEGISPQVQLWYFKGRCLKCRDCVSVCPEGALSFDKTEGLGIDRDLCSDCGACTKVCPTGALSFIGSRMTVDQIVQELLQDRVFYEESGGGITLTGGEPLAQAGAAGEILKRMKSEGISTAVETSLHVPQDVLESIKEVTDFFLCDLKVMNPERHLKVVGADNARIRENLKWLICAGADVLVRIPLIPGFTDSRENLQNIGEFLLTLEKTPPVELMNFNPLAREKFRVLGRHYEPEGADSPFDGEQMKQFRFLFDQMGLQVT